jgi:hypothetical protein
VDLAALGEQMGAVSQNKSDAPQAIAMQVRENSFRAPHTAPLLLGLPTGFCVSDNTLFTRPVLVQGVFHLNVRNGVRVLRRS